MSRKLLIAPGGLAAKSRMNSVAFDRFPAIPPVPNGVIGVLDPQLPAAVPLWLAVVAVGPFAAGGMRAGLFALTCPGRGVVSGLGVLVRTKG